MPASAIAGATATSDGLGHYGPVNNRMRGRQFRRVPPRGHRQGSRNPAMGGSSILFLLVAWEV